jgi:hypothetical protein
MPTCHSLVGCPLKPGVNSAVAHHDAIRKRQRRPPVPIVIPKEYRGAGPADMRYPIGIVVEMTHEKSECERERKSTASRTRGCGTRKSFQFNGPSPVRNGRPHVPRRERPLRTISSVLKECSAKETRFTRAGRGIVWPSGMPKTEISDNLRAGRTYQ